MKILKFAVIFFYTSLLFGQDTEDLITVLKENTSVLKDSSNLEAKWQNQEAELKAKIKLLKTVKKRLETDISNLKKQAQKESEFEKNLRQRLDESSRFEANMSKFLDEYAISFEQNLNKNSDAKLILNDVFLTLKSDSANVYSRASDVLVALKKALELSNSISTEEKWGGKYVRIGTSTLLDVGESENVKKLSEMLEGARAYDFIEISVSKNQGDKK